MNRRQALGALLAALTPSSLMAANPSVSTLIGTGSRGYSDGEVTNPYGLGPSGRCNSAISTINASVGSISKRIAPLPSRATAREPMAATAERRPQPR